MAQQSNQLQVMTMSGDTTKNNNYDSLYQPTVPVPFSTILSRYGFFDPSDPLQVSSLHNNELATKFIAFTRKLELHYNSVGQKAIDVCHSIFKEGIVKSTEIVNLATVRKQESFLSKNNHSFTAVNAVHVGLDGVKAKEILLHQRTLRRTIQELHHLNMKNPSFPRSYLLDNPNPQAPYPNFPTLHLLDNSALQSNPALAALAEERARQAMPPPYVHPNNNTNKLPTTTTTNNNNSFGFGMMEDMNNNNNSSFFGNQFPTNNVVTTTTTNNNADWMDLDNDDDFDKFLQGIGPSTNNIFFPNLTNNNNNNNNNSNNNDRM